MTQPKFTPGPWMAEVHEIGVDDPRLFGTITDSNGNDVDYISLRQEAVHANATLIAAAPDMYAALKEANDELDGVVSMLLDSYCLKLSDGSYDRGVMDDCEREDLERCEQRLAVVRAALTKAGRA